MSASVADFLVQRLTEWGVRRIYGYPGDAINGIMGALQRVEGRVEFVQVRHEEMAAFMACGHARWTGKPGACLAIVWARRDPPAVRRCRRASPSSRRRSLPWPSPRAIRGVGR
jgi:hypothetical protein